MGGFEQAFNILDTTKHYLSATGEISAVFRERNQNFVKYAGEILKAKTGIRKDAGYVLEKLRSDKAVESQNWLVAKMEELI